MNFRYEQVNSVDKLSWFAPQLRSDFLPHPYRGRTLSPEGLEPARKGVLEWGE